jgi:hypothetical protein
MFNFITAYLQDYSSAGRVTQKKTRDPWILHHNFVKKHFLFEKY